MSIEQWFDWEWKHWLATKAQDKGLRHQLGSVPWPDMKISRKRGFGHTNLEVIICTRKCKIDQLSSEVLTHFLIKVGVHRKGPSLEFEILKGS